MRATHFHQARRVFSASNVRWAIAEALNEIKEADDLTDEDLGKVLGKSPDRARAYRRQEATMDAETFGRAKREWNGRFTGYFDRLCEDSRPGKLTGRQSEGKVLAAALAMSVALSDDNEITDREILANRQSLEEAQDAIGALLARVGAGA